MLAMKCEVQGPPLAFSFLFFELSNFRFITTGNKIMVHLFKIINDSQLETTATVRGLCSYGMVSHTATLLMERQLRILNRLFDQEVKSVTLLTYIITNE